MVKATLLFVAFIAGFSIVVQLSRLAGVQARSFTDDLWRAATPAEFWNRYNRIINQFLFENVYRPIRRTRSPALAILLTFTISGIAHEYIFGISASRVYGYQTLFFMLQGVAVALTARFRPRGWNAVGAMIATLVFMVCTSVLFFVSFHTVIPLYAHALPAWLWGS
jgi:D-alanyl-lipoteichoic acid acyltransferase DltB (MBOAT superfamily)